MARYSPRRSLSSYPTRRSSDLFYMPVAGMSNPPMQRGYQRTVEGFWHALSRGQYEQPNPTNLVTEPGRFVNQLGMLVSGRSEEHTSELQSQFHLVCRRLPEKKN